MSNDPLNLALIDMDKFLDHGNGVFRQRQIRMHAPHATMSVRIHGNILLASDDAAVVTTIAAEIYPLLWTNTREQIDVALQMSGGVNDEGATIAEEVNCVWNSADWLPLMGGLLAFRAREVLGLRVWGWWELGASVQRQWLLLTVSVSTTTQTTWEQFYSPSRTFQEGSEVPHASLCEVCRFQERTSNLDSLMACQYGPSAYGSR